MLSGDALTTENINLPAGRVRGSVIDRPAIKSHNRQSDGASTVTARGHQHEHQTPDLTTNSGQNVKARSTTRRSRGHVMKMVTMTIDIAAAIVAVVVANAALGEVGPTAAQKYTLLSIAAPFFFLATFAQQGLYMSRHISRRADELRRLFNAAALGTIVLAAASVVLKLQVASTWLVIVGSVTLILAGGCREGIRRFIVHQRASGKLSRRVLLVGGNREADELLVMLSHAAELGYSVVGRVSDDVVDDGSMTGPSSVSESGSAPLLNGAEPPWLGHTDDVLEIAEANGISGVVVATTDIGLETANRLVRQLTNAGLYVEMSSAMRDIASRRVTVRPLGRYPVMTVEPIVSNGWRASLKRCFDVTLSILILTILSPIMIAAALAIRLTDGPGVLFRQTRVGRNGKEFTVYKLRTMVHNAEELLPSLKASNEAAGPMFKMTDDPRVTRVGAFLRTTSLDEVPQFLNVIRGEMSLVGPRPALPSEAEQWDDDLRERLRVKPGITGNWQVNGRFTASFEDYQRLDMYYVDNWSIITDLVIIAKTIPAVLKRNGAA